MAISAAQIIAFFSLVSCCGKQWLENGKKRYKTSYRYRHSSSLTSFWFLLVPCGCINLLQRKYRGVYTSGAIVQYEINVY